MSITTGWKEIEDYNQKIEQLSEEDLFKYVVPTGNFAYDNSLIKRLDNIMRDESRPWPLRIRAMKMLDIIFGCEQSEEFYTKENVETEIYFQKINNNKLPYPVNIVCGWEWGEEDNCYCSVAYLDPTYGWRIH